MSKSKKTATKKKTLTKGQRELKAQREKLRKIRERSAQNGHEPHVSAKMKGDLSERLAPILEKGVLLDLSIGFWTAMNRNTAGDLGIKEDKLPENIAGLGMKRLIEKEIADGWKKAAAHARYVLRKASFLFPVGQAAFVPLSALPALEAELFTLKDAFDKAWQYVGDHYDEIKDTMLKKYPKLDAALYPTKAEMMAQFYFDWAVYNVALPKRAQLAVFNKKKAKHDEEVLARYRHELEGRMTSFLARSVETLRAKTIQLCVSIGDAVKSGRVVTDRALDTLRSHIETHAQLDFIGDKEVEKRLAKLGRDLLGHSREEFEQSAELQRALSSSLDDIRRAAESVTDLTDIAGGYARRVRV